MAVVAVVVAVVAVVAVAIVAVVVGMGIVMVVVVVVVVVVVKERVTLIGRVRQKHRLLRTGGLNIDEILEREDVSCLVNSPSIDFIHAPTYLSTT